MFILLLPLLIPVYVWYVCDPRWHLYLTGACVLCAIIVLSFKWSALRKDVRQGRSNTVMYTSCAWPIGLSPEGFRMRLTIFFRVRGWRIVLLSAGRGDRIELILRKDRWRVALLFVQPGRVSGPEDLLRLKALAIEAAVVRSAIVEARSLQSAKALYCESGILTLRFKDLARLEVALGLSD